MFSDPLYQVQCEVRRHTGEMDLVRIGPKWSKESAEKFLMTINAQIALGREKHFCNPHVVLALADTEVN
jgi:hypothetical protein